ncbi:MAG: DUF5615 family PIN-like protein [Bacteroidales bacterium]
MIKILANENIPQKSVSLIKDSGIDIKSIGIENPSISDNEVIELANHENRTIITFDGDYSELIYKHGFKPKAGVIYFRIRNIKPDALAVHLLKILKTSNLDFNNKMTVIDNRKIRQRSF